MTAYMEGLKARKRLCIHCKSLQVEAQLIQRSIRYLSQALALLSSLQVI